MRWHVLGRIHEDDQPQRHLRHALPGGYYGPIPFAEQVPIIGLINITIKIVASLFLMIWIRASWPRFRYDQLMALGWKRLLPLSLANVVLTAAVIILFDEGLLASLF